MWNKITIIKMKKNKLNKNIARFGISLFILFLLTSAFFAVSVQAATDDTNGIDLTLDDVVSIIQKVAGYFYSIAIALAVIITIYVGILFFTAGGDDQQVGKAKKMMIWLIIGIAILLIGRGIITLVENVLTMAG